MGFGCNVVSLGLDEDDANGGLDSDPCRIDAAVLFVVTCETDIKHSGGVLGNDDDSVFIAADVENHPVTRQKVGAAEAPLNVIIIIT